MAFRLVYVAAALIGGLVETSAVAPNIVLDGARDAVFVYDASGTLIASISPTAGTDSHGNQYLAGITTYIGGVGAGFVQMYNNTLLFGEVLAGVPDTADASQLIAGSGEMDFYSGKNAAPNNDQVKMSLFGGQGGLQTGNTLNPIAQLLDTFGTSDIDLWISGSIIKTNKTGGIYTLQTPTMASGYTNVNLTYYADPLDRVVYDGYFTQNNAQAAAGGAVVTVAAPAPYQPKGVRVAPAVWMSSGGV